MTRAMTIVAITGLFCLYSAVAAAAFPVLKGASKTRVINLSRTRPGTLATFVKPGVGDHQRYKKHRLAWGGGWLSPTMVRQGKSFFLSEILKHGKLTKASLRRFERDDNLGQFYRCLEGQTPARSSLQRLLGGMVAGTVQVKIDGQPVKVTDGFKKGYRQSVYNASVLESL